MMVNSLSMDETPLVIRSLRKTYRIEIHPDGQVILRVPQRATRQQIDSLLRDKAGWIEKKVAQQRENHPALQPRRYVEGEIFDYLGESYSLKVVDRGNDALTFHQDQFCLRRKDQAKAAQLFEAWYRSQARAVLSGRVDHFAERHGFVYQAIRINGARTRWGSCSTRGGLNFTWRLIQAPLPVVDYVVVHELVHLKVPNHSKDFWDLVEFLVPDYAERRAWLKLNGNRLSV